jgi:hemerythrin-like domain-containing protein
VNPFQYLGNEHHELSEMLDVLDAMVRVVDAGQWLDRHDLDALLDYFREVGDMSHHDKEETILVPALVRHHMDYYDGPLAELRDDHRQERYLTRALRHAARQQAEWSEEDKRHFVSIAAGYSEFFRQHMRKESDRWFSEAADRLSEVEQDEIVFRFRKFDEEMVALPDFVEVKNRALALRAKYPR